MKGVKVSAEFTVNDPEVFRKICGNRNEHLKYLEEVLSITVGARGNKFLLQGSEEEVSIAFRTLKDMERMAQRGLHPNINDFHNSIKIYSENLDVTFESVFTDTILVTFKNKKIVPKSINQKKYVDAIRGNDIVFGIGPAGTGKTYLAMAMAVASLLQRRVNRIILTRPAVEAGEKLGFLPGDLAEKVNPYLRPLYDALYDMLPFDRVEELLARNVIEIAPLAFMRGRTLNDAFIILDEAQNATREQMKMFLTRLGVDSKAVVTGDITQIDLPKKSESGLVEALKILKEIEGIEFVFFDKKDVVRHNLVQKIIEAYDRYEESEKK